MSLYRRWEQKNQNKTTYQNYIAWWSIFYLMLWFKESAERLKTSFLKELVEKCRPT